MIGVVCHSNEIEKKQHPFIFKSMYNYRKDFSKWIGKHIEKLKQGYYRLLSDLGRKTMKTKKLKYHDKEHRVITHETYSELKEELYFHYENSCSKKITNIFREGLHFRLLFFHKQSNIKMTEEDPYVYLELELHFPVVDSMTFCDSGLVTYK
jgi:hypothetical protein